MRFFHHRLFSVRGLLSFCLLAALCLLFTAHPALAATTAPAATISMAWIGGLLLSIASVIVPGLVAWFGAQLSKRTTNTALLTDAQQALTDAGRIALDILSSVESHNLTLTVKNAAVATGINTVISRIQAAAPLLGYSDATITSLVSGEVAKALIVPTSTAVPPAAAA